MTPVLVLCILLCAASAASAQKENLPADVSEPQEEMMRMMVKEEEQELPEDLVPELKDGAEFEQAEGPEARCTLCPIGWYLDTGFCYKVFFRTKNWIEAAEDCHNHGGHLPSAPSAFQYDLLQQLARTSQLSSAWLGGVYAQDRWIWIDGQSFSYHEWDYQNSPASYPCIHLQTDDGWANNACSNIRSYICAKRAGC